MMGQGQMGPGMMGYGQMGPGQMGYGMMGYGQRGYGMGPRAMVGLGNRVFPIHDITVDDVRHFLEHRVEAQGYSRLRVGKVEEKDEDTISAEIDTADGALVQKLDVDRHTGLMTEVK
jgi:hypothetical protein